MRKSNQEIRDPALIEAILSGAQICRVAMMDGERPYVLPFNYGYRDRCIYIHSAPEGKKIELLKRNNAVCFEVEDHAEVIPADKACAWATRYRSVVGYGTVEIVTAPEEKEEGLRIIMEQHSVKGPFTFEPGPLKRMVILKLSISSLSCKQSSNWSMEQM